MTTKDEALALALEALESVAKALPLGVSTVKSCYGIDNRHRDAVHATITAIKQAQQAQELELEQHTLTYARNLCLHLARKFYPEVTQFEPQDDVLGMLTQIDNMTTELVREPAPKQAEQAEKRKLYECTGCGHLHGEKPSSCDCGENHGNDYNDWTASPTPREAT